MNILVAVFRELTGLFIDDGALALAILGVVLLAGLFMSLMPGLAIVAGGILLFGCLGVLLANVLRASQQ